MKIGRFFPFFSVIWHIVTRFYMDNIQLLTRFMWEERTFLPLILGSIAIPKVPRNILVINTRVVLFTFLSFGLKMFPWVQSSLFFRALAFFVSSTSPSLFKLTCEQSFIGGMKLFIFMLLLFQEYLVKSLLNITFDFHLI